MHVWNPSGKLIGKIYTGRTSANFQFVGGGEMVIGGGDAAVLRDLAAEGSFVQSQL